jgi:hypothetical protein
MRNFHSDREEAISWFKKLPIAKARALAINHTGRFINISGRFTNLLSPSCLTGKEIEDIWKTETKGENARINQ